MKVGMYGPHWPRRVDRRKELGHYEPFDEPAFEVLASTLGDGLKIYQTKFSVTVEPYDGSYPELPFEPGESPRYFFYIDTAGRTTLVDVHITRQGDDICPKQDLLFALQEGDLIEIGPLVC